MIRRHCAASSTCGWMPGADLGNHSFSHPDINNVPLEQYTADILKGEPAAARGAGRRAVRKLTYFRHPFPARGRDGGGQARPAGFPGWPRLPWWRR